MNDEVNFCSQCGAKISSGVKFCSNCGQRVKVVIKYLEEHPEKLHMHYAILLLEAMSDAFPCNDQ